jgi:hypothetical protein
MKEIPLRRVNKETREKEIFCYAIVDDNRYDEAMKYRWYCTSNGYAATKLPSKNGKNGKNLFLHHLILPRTEEFTMVDHIDTNKLNNQSSNLRYSNKSLNGINCRKRKHAFLSKYMGVQLNKKIYWNVTIGNTDTALYRGFFYTEEMAALMYNRKVTELFNGEQTLLNILDKSDDEIEKIELEVKNKRHKQTKIDAIMRSKNIYYDKSKKSWVIYYNHEFMGRYKDKKDGDIVVAKLKERLLAEVG